ncbi:MAG: hypothetical protein ACP5J0_03000 [Pyrobaculum sp.]
MFKVTNDYITAPALYYMYGLLILVINATVLTVPITSIPFIYTAPLGGCANFTAYVDPLSPWGIASVHAVSNTGVLTTPTFQPYPTPKFVNGRVCGDFLTVKVERWRSLGPVVPVTVKGEDSVYVYQGVPLEVNGTAILRVKSFTPPQVEGDFYFKVWSTQSLGVYMEEYVVYSTAKISAYGIANITYISLSDTKADYYFVIPTAGVRVDGVKPWTPDFNLMFSPNQTAAVGRPRVVVEQIALPVVGQCNGTALVYNPVERPLQIYVKLTTGEEYVLNFYHLPTAVKTWLFKGATAKTVDGQDLPVYAVSTEDGSPVAMCIVEGPTYYVYVKVGDVVYKYPAEVREGAVEAYTDLVKPRVVLDVQGFNATVAPEVARLGTNVTVRLLLNGSVVAEYVVRAAPRLVINASSLYREMRVVDVLGSPIDRFAVYVGGLKFYGEHGAARIIPLADPVAVEINGVKYLVSVRPVVKLPTLTLESFVKMFVAAGAVGAAAAVGVRGRREEKKEERGGRDVVEV